MATSTRRSPSSATARSTPSSSTRPTTSARTASTPAPTAPASTSTSAPGTTSNAQTLHLMFEDLEGTDRQLLNDTVVTCIGFDYNLRRTIPTSLAPASNIPA